MNPIYKLIAGLFTACLLLVAGPLHAAKAPKVDICHYDADEAIYKLIAVSGNAQQPHLTHGDLIPEVDNGLGELSLDTDCFAVVPPTVLARAYIDKNRDGEYDGTIDVDILQLLDSDGFPGFTVGDTVVYGQYPTTFDPCDDQITCPRIGTFTAPPDRVTFITKGQAPDFDFLTNRAQVEIINSTTTESIQIFPVANNSDDTSIQDSLPAHPFCVNGIDIEFVNRAAEGADILASETSSHAAPCEDEYFLNVEFPPA